MTIFIAGSYLPTLPGSGSTHHWFPGVPFWGPLGRFQKLILIPVLSWWCGRLTVSKALESLGFIAYG